MSKRDALRKLSKKFPPPPEIERIFSDLGEQPDMVVAIAGAALVEGILEKFLVNSLPVSNKQLVGELFAIKGPLGDFYSKILVARAFGRITSPMVRELNSIRAIRNVFAHSKVPISFETSEITKVVDESGLKTAIKNVEIREAHKMNLNNKEWYALMCQILYIMLMGPEDEYKKELKLIW